MGKKTRPKLSNMKEGGRSIRTQFDMHRLYYYIIISVVHLDVYLISVSFLIAFYFSLPILSLRKMQSASRVESDWFV